MADYAHICFRKNWTISYTCAIRLGQCKAIAEALANTPLRPKEREKLHGISLVKGAQATTAIEGNTLTAEEIEKLQEGWKLPPSREYQETEVKNVIEAFNILLSEIAIEKKEQYINIELIKRFHVMIGKNLGEHFNAIPGKFREDSRVVGKYLAPDYREVHNLMNKLCNWLRDEFNYNNNQTFSQAVIQAIVTHIYIEWIHPFGDGNGRTGRLLEFYILLRAGLPSIASHILSNFYNLTRPEYYRHFDNARNKKDLTDFIEYAVLGFRDGLKTTLGIIQEGHFQTFWHNYIYEKFASLSYTKKDAFKRKRDLILEMPIGKELDIDEIILLTPKIAKKYANLNRATILRDLKELREIDLLVKTGKKYKANSDILKSMMPSKKV